MHARQRQCAVCARGEGVGERLIQVKVKLGSDIMAVVYNNIKQFLSL